MKNPMVHFEIPVDDIDRAKDFYTKTFDWRIEKFDIPGAGSVWVCTNFPRMRRNKNPKCFTW